MKRIPELIVVSTERSGTNFFGSCLRRFDQGVTFFEVFAQDAVYGLEAYPQVAKRFGELISYDIQRETDPALARLVHAEPVKHLKLLHQSAAERGAQFFCYKLFPGHLHPSKVKLAMAEDEVRVIFLVRRRLDCFISFQKALQLEAWQSSDTTAEKIAITTKQFMEWAQSRDQWFNNLYRHTLEAGVPRQILSYDLDIDRPQAAVLAKCDFVLKSFGVEAPRLTVAGPSEFKKQDKADSPFAKISNGSEVEEAFRAADLLDYALSPFLGNDRIGG
mgnify:FL=1